MPIHKAPSHTPALSLMLDDLGRPQLKRLAKLLDVHPRTLRRWIDRDHAPRPVLLALYWLTSWGRQDVHLSAHNDAKFYAGYVRCLNDEVRALRRELARLLALGHFDSANDPLQQHVSAADIAQVRAEQAAQGGGVGVPAVEGVPVRVGLVVPLFGPRDAERDPGPERERA